MDWRALLYKKYISSGQAALTTKDLKVAFASQKPYIQYVIRTFLKKEKDAKIIDLGCGRGSFVYFLMEEGYRNVEGIDISEEQVAYAKDLGLENVHQGDLNTFVTQLSNDSVDVFILLDILEHFTRTECFSLIDIVFDKLKAGGQLIVHVPNAQGVFGSTIRYGDLTHEQAFTVSSLNQMFNALGFSQTHVFEDKPLIYSFSSLVRRLLWQVLSFPFRLLHLAETGTWSVPLSRNLLAIVTK